VLLVVGSCREPRSTGENASTVDVNDSVRINASRRIKIVKDMVGIVWKQSRESMGLNQTESSLMEGLVLFWGWFVDRFNTSSG